MVLLFGLYVVRKVRRLTLSSWLVWMSSSIGVMVMMWLECLKVCMISDRSSCGVLLAYWILVRMLHLLGCGESMTCGLLTGLEVWGMLISRR